MNRSIPIGHSMLVAAMSAIAAPSANLLPNGDFGSVAQIAGWDYTFSPAPADATFVWSSDDVVASADSGSIELGSQYQGIADAGPPCFAVVANAPFEFGVHGKLVAGSDIAANLYCRAYPTYDCTDIGSTALGGVDVPLGANWAIAIPLNGDLPDGAQTVRCAIVATSQNGQRGFAARFDALYFLSTPPVIFADGFDPGAP